MICVRASTTPSRSALVPPARESALPISTIALLLISALMPTLRSLMSAFTAGCHVIDVTFMDHYPSCEGLRTAKAAAAMRRSWLQDPKLQPPPMSG
jgi:hypothetical protein